MATRDLFTTPKFEEPLFVPSSSLKTAQPSFQGNYSRPGAVQSVKGFGKEVANQASYILGQNQFISPQIRKNLPTANISSEQQGGAQLAKNILSPGTEFVQKPLEKRGVNPLLAGFAGLAVDVATPGPGELKSATKGAKVFEGFSDLTTKVLDRLKGKSKVSKQFISDLTNSPDLKQAEWDLFRRVLDESIDNNPLTLEARKYKSAEEFVKAQGQSVFRGGDNAIDVSRGSGRGISVSDKETAGLFTPPKGGVVDEAILPKTAKILKEGDIPKNLQDAYIKEAKVLADPNNFSSTLQKSVIEKQQAIIEYARKNGFDAVEFPFEKEIRIVKPDVLKSKSQLTDIWNKAKESPGVFAFGPLLASQELFIKKEQKNPEPQFQTTRLQKAVKAIGDHETNVLYTSENKPYKPANILETYSYVQPFSGALGRYQVEPPTLKTYSRAYLGREVSPKEFLSNPTLQDQFVRSILAHRMKDFNLTLEEAIAAHNVGLNGDYQGTKGKKYLQDVQRYLK